jgi:hypothetical protein
VQISASNRAKRFYSYAKNFGNHEDAHGIDALDSPVIHGLAHWSGPRAISPSTLSESPRLKNKYGM